MELIKNMVSKFSKEPDRPNVNQLGAGLLWCPFAEIEQRQMITRGFYRKKHPEGATIHYTAGRGKGGKTALSWGVQEGYCYFLIDIDGTIYQSFPLNRRGWHAGKSYWPGLGKYVSSYLVGIEISCAGKLIKTKDNKFKTTYGNFIPNEDVRFSEQKDNIYRGYYQKYTPEQEESLIALLLWLKRNKPDVFSFDKVLGHDEVRAGWLGLGLKASPKTDPGSSLSWTMPEFRALLKQRYEEVENERSS
jgi:N-acetyl-anhydromuramyl-L-alanine amidase AmpD